MSECHDNLKLVIEGTCDVTSMWDAYCLNSDTKQLRKLQNKTIYKFMK